MLHHAVRHLAHVCDDIVVVAAPGAEPPLPSDPAVRVTHDVLGGEGPLAGAYAGLLVVRTELALLAGGDMPDLQVSVLEEMVRTAGGSPAEAVVLREGEGFRPLPSILRAGRALDVAHSLLHAGERRLRSLLRALQVTEIEEATWTALDPARRTLFDVDEPDDLER